MDIKISVSSFKKVGFLNGLLPYAEDIAQQEMDADEGEVWDGYAVVHLQAVESTRKSGTGELVPSVQIDRIELVTSEVDEQVVRELLGRIYAERNREGTIMDPEVVEYPEPPEPFQPLSRSTHQGALRSAVERAQAAWSPADEISGGVA